MSRLVGLFIFLVVYLSCFVIYESMPATVCTCVTTSDEVFEDLFRCYQEDDPYPVITECSCPDDPRTSPPDEMATYTERAFLWRSSCQRRAKKERTKRTMG